MNFLIVTSLKVNSLLCHSKESQKERHRTKILGSRIAIAFALILGYCPFVQAQNGFAIWSKGGGCDRELHYTPIADGEAGREKLAVKKGVGADIWPHISYDGQWIAWARSNARFGGRYGKCDYHSYEKFDIYIARIEYGLKLPAEPIKVAHGYWPSWGDDAGIPNKSKTLYFTHYESKSIKKTIIHPDGTFAEPEEYHKFEQEMGTRAHIQMSPNGKFLLYRPDQMRVYSLELKKDISDTLSGCHPCWGPRSKYFIKARDGVYYNTDTSVIYLGKAGVGPYFQGISNDAYWDEGKLWVIGRFNNYSDGANSLPSVKFRAVDISNNGWKYGPSTEIGRGDACDIHMFPKDFDPLATISVPQNKKGLENRVSFTTQIKTTGSGLQLVICPLNQREPIAELFNMRGNSAGFQKTVISGQTTIAINNIVNGIVVLKISDDKEAVKKTLFITR